MTIIVPLHTVSRPEGAFQLRTLLISFPFSLIARGWQRVEDMIEKQIGKEFHICDKCGYDRGFHVSFERGEGHCEIVLICPNCGQRYGVGWKITLAQDP